MICYINKHTDDNECELNSELCYGGTCLNGLGDYRCICGPGFVVGSQGKSCIGINNLNC